MALTRGLVAADSVPTPTTIELVFCPWGVDGEETLGSIFDAFEYRIQAVAAEEGRYRLYKQKAMRRNKKRALRGHIERFNSEFEDGQHDCVLYDLIRNHRGGEEF
ncbi:hypothetical protein AC578_7752 [Pseudocercospora eumusae]|uniref:Uncharacterized protein n=1 Tax=Pseudocercospora eumusae TaxID=321146 RepID=A0A139HL12_9PEZI|nr:hypothetical protein AC578_7752 [Pseudocercospora eumusae]